MKAGVVEIDSDFDYEGRQSVIRYLEGRYGHDKVCHIGTFSTLKVKSGLKDVGRTLEYDFPTMNGITKQIDEISDDPNLSFKKLDRLAEGDAKDKAIYAKFKNLEDQYPELFRLARRFEGVPKGYGVHASGILITPFPIKEGIPTRALPDGTIVTLNTGVQLENLGYIKFDILGLKTISVIKNTLKSINEELTFDDLYAEVKFDDDSIYNVIRKKNTDGLFQIESNLFKGMIEDIIPTEFNDIVVMSALGRPGPLSAGMPAAYAKRKNGLEEARPMLPGIEDITDNSLGTLAYQEQLMLIAKRVAGYSDNQSDSYLRKATAKKQKDKMAMCRQWFIYGKRNEKAPEGYDESNLDQVMYDPTGKHGEEILGGINNGYDAKQLAAFWKDIEGYCDYLFNLSHSACYSYITILTAYLKALYPAEFMAATLSMEEKEEKVAQYITSTEAMGLKVLPPSINESGKSFTPKGKRILFGLASIKGIGEAKVDELLLHRPFTSTEDILERVEKKFANKTVMKALAKSGALDEFNPNRHASLNLIYDIRKDKDERYDEMSYDKLAAMTFEKELLGTPVSVKPQWDKVKVNKKITQEFSIVNVNERADKSGRMMGFIDLETEGVRVKGLMFASKYASFRSILMNEDTMYIAATGKKDDKGTFLIDSVKAIHSIGEDNVEEAVAEKFYAILS